jgi:hypothetical protein
MSVPTKPIAPMDKITLHIQAVPRDGNSSRQPAEADVTFICGIGSSGLIPFEHQLIEKRAGETVTMPVEPGAAEVLFGHLNCMLHQAIGITPPFDLHASVVSVTTPEGREVVKAMAQMTGGCGGGCSCGCGC